MKKIYVLLLLTALTGCAEYNPEVLYPITNINDFYKQCKNSETINLNTGKSLSFSDRYYCLGFVQAAAETTIYWRRKIKDYNPQCHLKVSDFYHELILSMEAGRFNERTSIPGAFNALSYKFCPKTQLATRTQYNTEPQLKAKTQYINQEDMELFYGR